MFGFGWEYFLPNSSQSWQIPGKGEDFRLSFQLGEKSIEEGKVILIGEDRMDEEM